MILRAVAKCKITVVNAPVFCIVELLKKYFDSSMCPLLLTGKNSVIP